MSAPRVNHRLGVNNSGGGSVHMWEREPDNSRRNRKSDKKSVREFDGYKSCPRVLHHLGTEEHRGDGEHGYDYQHLR